LFWKSYTKIPNHIIGRKIAVTSIIGIDVHDVSISMTFTSTIVSHVGDELIGLLCHTVEMLNHHLPFFFKGKGWLAEYDGQKSYPK
jgi:hypothetical protein